MVIEPPVKELCSLLMENFSWISLASRINKVKETVDAKRYRDEDLGYYVYRHFSRGFKKFFKKSVSQGKALISNNPEYSSWIEPLQQELKKYLTNRVGEDTRNLPYINRMQREVTQPQVKDYSNAAIALYHRLHQTVPAAR